MQKGAPKQEFTIRLRPETVDALKMAAVYHEVGWQTYLQWLVTAGLRTDARYYGWILPAQKRVTKTLKKTSIKEQTLTTRVKHIMEAAKLRGSADLETSTSELTPLRPITDEELENL